MRGRKPTLTAIDGGRSRVPPAPSWMPKEAKTEWRRVMPDLIGRRILSDADMGQVENYCVAIAQVRQCQAALDAGPMFFKTDTSGPRPHPAFRTAQAAMTIARQLAAELGLTPVSRHRAGSGGQDEGDEWSGLVDG